MLAERCQKAGMPFIIGACQPDPAIMLNRVRRARRCSLPPFRSSCRTGGRVTNEEAIDFLNRASDTANGIPLVLYNPPHAKRVLSPPELGVVLGQHTGASSE